MEIPRLEKQHFSDSDDANSKNCKDWRGSPWWSLVFIQKQALLICGPYSASMRQRPQPCTYSEVVSPSVTQWNSIDLLYSDCTSHDIYWLHVVFRFQQQRFFFITARCSVIAPCLCWHSVANWSWKCAAVCDAILYLTHWAKKCRMKVFWWK